MRPKLPIAGALSAKGSTMLEDSSRHIRRTPRSFIPILLVVALAATSGAAAWWSSRTISAPVGPEGVVIVNAPDLAPASSTRIGPSVDGIKCQREVTAVVKYHLHVHVVVYVDGHARRLPAGIGFTPPALVEHTPAGTMYEASLYDCLYALHTHAADGIVHVEAAAPGNFTLGELFDIWNQPLGPHQVGPATGTVVVFENGRRLSGNPRATPLLAHGDIQIDVGLPIVPFQPFTFHVTGSCGQGTLGCTVPTT